MRLIPQPWPKGCRCWLESAVSLLLVYSSINLYVYVPTKVEGGAGAKDSASSRAPLPTIITTEPATKNADTETTEQTRPQEKMEGGSLKGIVGAH